MKSLSSRGLRLAAMLALCAGFILLVRGSVATVNAADPPCVTKAFKFKEVKKACADGGQKAAKTLMKSVVKKARKAGDEAVSGCLDCHTDLKSFERNKKANALLKKYLK